MLVDANILVYAVDSESRAHAAARDWLTRQLNGPGRVAIPWQSIAAFLRIVTHHRIFTAPMSSAEAWEIVEAWLETESVWTPVPGPKHAEILADLIEKYEPRADLVPDTMLVALAIEHGLAVCSSDTDFARFTEIEWRNPITS